MASDTPITRSAWQDRLATLPGSPDAIPPFFFGHGSPLLVFSKDVADREVWMQSAIKHYGPESPLSDFLRDFGPALLAKYQPKGILVFSAHWETQGEQLGMSFSMSAAFVVHSYRETVTDYGDENPLLMDYYNLDPEFYQLKFSSRGDAMLSKRVVELFQNVLLLRPHSFCSRRPSHTPLSFCRLVLALVRPQRTKPVVSMDGGSRDQAWTTVSSLHSSSCSAKNSAACPSCKPQLMGR